MEKAIKELKINRYPTYKDSEVNWIGEIPESWEIQKGKWLFVKQERPVRKDDEIITCFRDGQVTLRTNRKTEGFTNALKEHGYQGIRKGDLVIHNMDAFAGAIGVSDSDGKSTPVYSACTPRKQGIVNPYFYAYLLKNLAKIGFIESLAKGIRERSSDFRFNDFGVLFLSVPPINEQAAIANFLDHKTTLIDQAIGIKEKQIELLKERRQILIHNAVTRGLKPNVKKKDSGVEWIGEIPEHWEVKRLSAFGRFSKGGGISRAELTETGLPAILYGDIYTKYDLFIKDVYHKVSEETAKKSIPINRNIILFTGSGETMEDIGKCVVYLSDETAFAGGDVIIYTQSENDSLFLSYALNTEGAKFEKAKSSKGEIIVHTYGSKLKEIKIAIPPKNEQMMISQFIETSNQKIATAISLKIKEIEKLREYKASLINSAVTGKIKVS